eukprot:515625_1
MYGPLLVHMFDTATDAGVLVEWYLLAQQEKNDSNFNVPGLDMTVMFWCNMSTILLYRVISTVWIYRLTHSVSHSILQFFDVLLFKAIYVCWKLKRKEPSNPQQYLQKLEGVFESTPQAVLQLIFIWKVNQNINYLVIMSLVFSLISLSTRFSGDDEKLFQIRTAEFSLNRNDYKNSPFTARTVPFWRVFNVIGHLCVIYMGCFWMGVTFIAIYIPIEFIFCLIAHAMTTSRWGWEQINTRIYDYHYFKAFLIFMVFIQILFNDFSKTDSKFIPIYRCFLHWILLILCTYLADIDVSVDYVGFISFLYCYIFVLSSTVLLLDAPGYHFFYRHLWRIFDVTTRICILCMIWISIGGWFLTIYICFEFLLFLLISMKYGKYEILFQLVGIMIINDIHKNMKMFFPIYRYLMHLLLLGLCTFFIMNDLCIPYLPDCPV